MRAHRHIALLLTLGCACMAGASTAQDTDHDGLSDAQEQALLDQFSPHFMVSAHDCAGEPAQFARNTATPKPLKEDGTIYGQAFPVPGAPDKVELHYYHLWDRDCGEMGHFLDTEHVSVLLQADAHVFDSWHAQYWYASAHEDTVCDASHIARASTLHAEENGATVWISAGKHASFLNEELCHSGCGGDSCVDSVKLHTAAVVNLGEASAPMNGSTWIAASVWPLETKMTRTDFTPVRLARLQRMPPDAIAWANPEKRPQEAVIHGGNSTLGSLATSGRSTDNALALADGKTGGALQTASKNTGHALGHSLGAVGHALGTATSHTGHALGVNPQ